MKCIIEAVGIGYYRNVNRQPRWVDSLSDAKVFNDLRTARAVVRMLHANGIDADVLDYELIKRIENRFGQR